MDPSIVKALDGIDVPLDKLKYIEKQFPIPKYKLAYAIVSESDLEHWSKAELAERQAFLDRCTLHDEMIAHISQGFQSISLHDPHWNIQGAALDYSPASLKHIDKVQNRRSRSLQGTYKKDFVKKYILPELYCYVLTVIQQHVPEDKWWRVYANNPIKMKFQPGCGKKSIEPYKYLEMCVFGGFKVAALYDTLVENVRDCH